MSLVDTWIAQRAGQIDSGEVRAAFARAKQLRNPIDLSIGQPDFDVPSPVKQALIAAVEQGRNGYALTQGVAELRAGLQQRLDDRYGAGARSLLVTSGSSGALTLAMLALIDPGDEAILLDPYFFIYPSLVRMAGGRPVIVPLDDEFHLPLDRIAAAITARTKVIVVNSPSNPTGVCLRSDELQQLAELASDSGVCLVSDEIYSSFCFDQPHHSPAEFNSMALVIDGFSKSHAMTGWRLAYAHGPPEVIEAMTQLQQFTFVCAPHPVQVAGVAALDCDVSPQIDLYRRRRDRVVEQLQPYYEFACPDGAFYLYPRLPWGSSRKFLDAAYQRNLLLVPGRWFSQIDTHFRISFAVDDRILDQGIQILKELAAGHG